MAQYQCSSFTVDTQEQAGITILHCQVHRWSASVAREMLLWLHDWGEQVDPDTVVLAPVCGGKQSKFLDLLGFESEVSEVDTTHGIRPYRQLLWPISGVDHGHC